MSKVKVGKEVFEAFKETENDDWYFEKKEDYLTLMFYYKAHKCFADDTEVLNEISFSLFLKVLSDGYELELTPHEKIKLEFEEKYKNESVFNEGFYKGILFVLKELDEKVEGVNK